MNGTLRNPHLVLTLAGLALLAMAGLAAGVLVRDFVVAAEARASEEPAPLPVSSRIQLEAVGTQRDGITGRPRAAQSFALAAGESRTSFVYAGTAKDPSICLPGVSTEPSETAAVQWRLDVSAVRIADGRTTIRLHWTRARKGAPSAERDETNQFTLGPDDSHVLDFVENADPASNCASLFVRASAQPIVPANARPAVVDLWTVDEASGRAARSVHGTVEGPSGKLLNYTVAPMEIAPAGGEQDEPLTMEVAGTIAVSPSEDGLVEIDLATTCRTKLAKSAVMGQGRVHFRAKPGETAALLLPNPQGRIGLSSGAGSMDLSRAFDGHQVALYVKVELR